MTYHFVSQSQKLVGFICIVNLEFICDFVNFREACNCFLQLNKTLIYIYNINICGYLESKLNLAANSFETCESKKNGTSFSAAFTRRLKKISIGDLVMRVIFEIRRIFKKLNKF